MDKFICKIDGEEKKSLRSLHSYIAKCHKMLVADYYMQYYPRKDKLTNEPIYFSNYDKYFSCDFVKRENMLKWLEKAPEEEAKNWCLNRLQKRIEEKKLRFAPCQNELRTSFLMPEIKHFEKFFGSYEKACNLIDERPLLKTNKFIKNIKIPKNYSIYIDTREQQPLKFKNSINQKLSFGDYTLDPQNYTYTFVDRKSENDFFGTMSGGYDRFRRELDSCMEMDSFMYIVIETSIDQIYENVKKGGKYKNVKLEFIFLQMRKILQDYPRRVQFIFSGSRSNSQKIIPYLLFYGYKLWELDVQYYLKKKGSI